MVMVVVTPDRPCDRLISHLSQCPPLFGYDDRCLVRCAGRPDEHIFISFSLSVHEAVLEFRTKLKIDMRFDEHQQMQRNKI
jgi:hypothetical protein